MKICEHRTSDHLGKNDITQVRTPEKSEQELCAAKEPGPGEYPLNRDLKAG